MPTLDTFQHLMKVIVIGGHTRNIGKTSVAAGLIRELRELGWTAVKITQYGHGVCSRDGEPCRCAPTRHAFVLTEEPDPSGRADTSRLLAAGARRSLWLRVRQDQLGDAFPILERALNDDEHVLIESNSILAFIRPRLYLAVLDGTKKDFKESARRFLPWTDALIGIGAPPRLDVWPGVDFPSLVQKPQFSVTAGDYFSPDLVRFVRARLSLT
jgi:hypothetical protein